MGTAKLLQFPLVGLFVLNWCRISDGHRSHVPEASSGKVKYKPYIYYLIKKKSNRIVGVNVKLDVVLSLFLVLKQIS